MNIDENVRKLLMALLRKWKLLVVFAIIGGLLGAVYTYNFTKLTYTSSVEFLATAVDSKEEMLDTSDRETQSEAGRISYTSKMNYAMKMMDTYIELLRTNEFNNTVASQLNERLDTTYSANTVKNSITITPVENTAMFLMSVTTNSADLSYEIAHQLEITVPDTMRKTNNGLVQASVEDKPIKAVSAGSKGYIKKCLIGAIAGLLIAAAYVIIRTMLDVRVRTSEELVEVYGIPVLGAIPDFEIKSSRGSYKIDTQYDTSRKGDK